MFKNLGLKAKMMAGSAGPLILVVILGIFVYTCINALMHNSQWIDHTHEVIEEAMTIEAAAVDMETGMRGYLLAGKDEFLAPYTNGQKRFYDMINTLQKTVNDNPAQVQRLDDIRDTIKDWQENVTEPTIALRREIGQSKTMDDMRDLVREAKGKVYFDKFRGQIKQFIEREQALMIKRKEEANRSRNVEQLRKTANWIDHTHTVIAEANGILAAAVDMETGMRGYLLAGRDDFLNPYKSGQATFYDRIRKLQTTVNDNPAQVTLLDEIKSTIQEWQTNVTEPAIKLRRDIGDAKSMNDMAALVGEARGKKYFDKFRGQIKTFIETEAGLMKKRQTDSQSTANYTIQVIVGGTITTVIIALIISFFIATSITRSFKQMFQGLTSLSNRELDNVKVKFKNVISGLSTGSDQISSASQTIAEGASEQASSIEETSSSLEEMSSMTRNNANNATEANSLMVEANKTVDIANESMSELTVSMEDISKASEETSKIIKTIDEIAFQTNLLALNAAVEAARAGEAGAGFAVVADEVRNLAMRAADAAKNTAGLIESTVKKIKEGSDVVLKTNEAFTEVSTSTTKVGELVNEIATASDEQADGIGQINKAMVEMDKVVQANAAGTEELSAQGDELKKQVDILLAIVEGGGSNIYSDNSSRSVSIHRTEPGHNKQTIARALPGREVDPEKVIPMDEDDFTDF